MKNNNTAFLRRTLLKSMSAALLGTASGLVPLYAQTRSSGIKLRKLHCFEIRVSDVNRSVSFYQDLFGLPVISTYGGRTCLGIGEQGQFMAIRALAGGEKPAITQLGYSTENFDIDAHLRALGELGFTRTEAPAISEPGITNAMHSWVRMRGDTPELYFADARGLIVQLADPSYCGGSGALGNQCPAPKTVGPGLFRLAELNHFTAFVNDGAGANLFYQQAFDLEVQAYQGPGSPVTGIGDGKQFVMYAGPFPGGENAPANIHHGSINMYGFDEHEVIEKLTDYGLTARGDGQLGPMMHYISRRMPERGGAEGGTPELYYTDPDGILMQLQDITYCGGGGYLGNECLKS